MKEYKTGIYVGKFYPFHMGHLNSLNKILKYCEKVYLVVFYTNASENKLTKELVYNVDERIEDIKKIVKDKNVEVVKYSPSTNYTFPKDYLKIKEELFAKIGVESIDLQIFGKDEEDTYKEYIYAKTYITSDGIMEDGKVLHATLIRREYSKYRKYLDEVITKRLDERYVEDSPIPQSVLEYGFDFDWDEQDVWKIECKTSEIDINELAWHFDVPFWNFNNKWYVLTPNEVLENKEKYKQEYERILNSDITYSIDVMENKGRLVILDGLHRLVKCKLLNMDKVKVRIIPREKIKEIAKMKGDTNE